MFCYSVTYLVSILGHKDSVTCTGFSYDRKYVATADMSGIVQVWKVATGECIWTYECTDLEVWMNRFISYHYVTLDTNFLVATMASQFFCLTSWHQ